MSSPVLCGGSVTPASRTERSATGPIPAIPESKQLPVQGDSARKYRPNDGVGGSIPLKSLASADNDIHLDGLLPATAFRPLTDEVRAASNHDNLATLSYAFIV